MRVTIDGQRAEMSTKRFISPDRWITSKGTTRSKTDYEKGIDNYLKHLTNQIYLKQQELESKNREVTAKSLINAYLRKDDEKRTILSLYTSHNRKLKMMVGKDVAFNTYKRHETSKKHLARFIKIRYKMSDFYIRDITPEFVDDYETYFRVERNCNNNTTVKYMRNFGKIIRIALKNEWITSNPLKNLKYRIEPVNREYLTWEELQKLESKKIKLDRIALVRDIFLFSCYTGLAYVDVSNLRPENIEEGSDGSLRIRIRRHKTGQGAFIPLLPPAVDLIEKYRDHPNCLKKGVLLPVLSNQKMNAYLKEIADICGIQKNLTTHSARHTFATTVTMANNISMESVSKMLGHSNLVMTKQYARILDRTITKEMRILSRKLLKRKSPDN